MMGPPGSGKGTQAERIASSRGLAHISTGDMLRAAMSAGTPLGLQVKEIVERGDLVPDDLMLALVDERLQADDAGAGFLLDGFPRTVAQAEGLQAVLEQQGAPLGCIVLLSVPDDRLVERAMARGRADDDEATIRHRLEVYRKQTEPVLGWYEGKVPVYEVDGVGGIEEITERITSVLDDADQP